MKFTSSEKSGIIIFALEGKMMGTPDESSLRDAVHRLADRDATQVVLDMSKLDWMTSGGLGTCVALLTTLRNRGSDLRLASIPPVIKSLMERCRILSLFRHFDTVGDAVKSYIDES